MTNRRHIIAASAAAAIIASARRTEAQVLVGSGSPSLATPLRMRARRLLTLAQNGALPTAMASPPTITLSANNTATTISGGVYVYATDTPFSYLSSQPIVNDSGSGQIWNGFTLPTVKLVKSGTTDQGGTPRSGGVMRVRFGYNGQHIDLCVNGGSTGVRIFVNGQPTAITPKTDLSGFNWRQYVVDFGSAANRTIDIELGKDVQFGGVVRDPNYNVYKVPAQPFRLMGIGDSYFEGGNNSGSMLMTLFYQASKTLGITDVWNVGEGSTGFISTGNQSHKTYQAKLAGDVLPYAPDWVVFAGGITDTGQTAATVQTLAIAYFRALLDGLPAATPVTVIGPWRAPSLNPATAIFDAMKAACVAQPEYGARLMYFDTLADNLQQIAGKVGTTSGTGNSNVFIGADGIHTFPTAGDDYLATYIDGAVRRHAAALAA